MIPWQTVLAIYLFFSVVLSLIRRSISQKTKLPDTIIPALSYLLVVFPGGSVLGLILGDFEIDWSAGLAVRLSVMALLIATFNWLSFKALRQVSVAVFQTIFQLFSVTAVVGGWLFLGESLSLPQIGGGVLLILGALFAAQSLDANKKSHKSGVTIAIIASVCLGLGAVTEKSILNDIDTGAYFLIGWGVQTIGVIVVSAKSLLSVRRADITKSDWLSSVVLGFCMLGVGTSFIYSLANTDNVGLVALTAAFVLPLSTLASYFLLNEKDLNRKILIGLAFGFVGILLVAV